MKIAELFVALGFKMEGGEKLEKVEKGLVKAELTAVKLLAGVSALNAGFVYMMSTAATAAVSLQKFALSTGLSTDELQRWQMAARLGNVQGEEITQTIEAIQKAQADLKLGQGNIAPWQFFGVSINQTPFEVLKTLHRQFQTMDPAIARTMAAQLGITENLFQWLRRDNLELEQFNQNLRLTAENQKRLQGINRAWQEISVTLIALKDRFAALFARPLEIALKAFKSVLDVVVRFVDWLNRGSLAANIIRGALVILVAGLLALGAALTVIVTGLGLAIGAMKLLTLAALPILVELAPIALVLGIMAAALVTLVTLIQDFWVACRGGKSAFDWNDNLLLSVKNVERLARAIEWVNSVVDKGGGWKNVFRLMNPLTGGAEWLSEKLLPAPDAGRAPSSVEQNNHTEIHIDGAGDPQAVGRETAKSLKDSIAEVSYRLALTSI